MILTYLIVAILCVLMFLYGLWLRPSLNQLWVARPAEVAPVPIAEPKVDVEPQYREFENSYRQNLIEQFRLMHFWSPFEQKLLTLPREQFFINPDFYLINDNSRRLRLSDLFDNFHHLALLGPPGCGKTETIYYFLLTQARQPNQPLPILLSATKLMSLLNITPQLPLATFLEQQMPAMPTGYLAQQLSQGRFLIILEGLNKLYISEAEQIMTWLKTQIARYPNHRFMLIARPILQDTINSAGIFTLVNFAGFETDTLEKFAQQWQQVIPQSIETTASILQDDVTYNLARTPFHFLMMLVVAKAVKSLPTRRVILYPTYLNMILADAPPSVSSNESPNESSNESSNEGAPQFSENERRMLLQGLAFTMHQRHLIYMDKESMCQELQGIIENESMESGGDTAGADFVRFCLTRGLLVRRNEQYRFAELGLQEFLTAREIAENRLYQLMAKQANFVWWHDVRNFYAELTYVRPVINRIFTQETRDLVALDKEKTQALSLLEQSMAGVGGEGTAKPATMPEFGDETEVQPPPKILVVDDTPQNLKFARFILEKDKYEVAEANDAYEAIEWLKKEKPTLILSDIQMPGMDGYEFCQYLKANDELKNIPFIFVTAFSRASKEIVKGLRMGADDYVPRPFSPEELLARIGANVRIHQAEESARRQAAILARRNRELALLNQLQQAVTSSLNLDDVLNTTLEQVQTVLQAKHTSLWFVDQDNQSMLLSAAFDMEGLKTAQGIRLPMQEGIQSQVVQSGQPFFSNDVLDDPACQLVTLETDETIRSMICIPLRIRQRVIGFLQTVHHESGHFKPDDFRLLNSVADSVTVAIENAWLFGQLQLFNQQLEQKVQARTRELVREKDKTETILISLADGLLVIDPDKQILMANQHAENWLNFKLTEDLGTSIDHAKFNFPLWHFVRKIDQQSDDTYTDTVEVPHPKNPERIMVFQANAAKMWDKTQHAYLGTVIVLRDITALQEVDRMKARFMTGITHELKTPIAAITMFIYSLLKTPTMEETKKTDLLQRIQKQSQLLNQLVENILHLSKLDSGMLQLQLQPLDMVELTRDIVDELQPLAKNKTLGLVFNTSQEQITVEADKGQLSRVIRNLVENAIKYTPQGRVTVALSQNERVKMAVTDTGIGLTDEQLEKLFQRFYRADPSHNIPGTGLGLSIAREIAKLHKGDIEVTSVANKGSTFTLVLPFKK